MSDIQCNVLTSLVNFVQFTGTCYCAFLLAVLITLFSDSNFSSHCLFTFLYWRGKLRSSQQTPTSNKRIALHVQAFDFSYQADSSHDCNVHESLQPPRCLTVMQRALLEFPRPPCSVLQIAPPPRQQPVFRPFWGGLRFRGLRCSRPAGRKTSQRCGWTPLIIGSPPRGQKDPVFEIKSGQFVDLRQSVQFQTQGQGRTNLQDAV